MIDVEVKNFQSIECVNFQVQGFTALVGRSNIGKSAVVRAVKAALTTAPSTSFVRHPLATCLRKQKGTKTCKCQCSVRLKGDDFDLLWEKGDAINRYTFNGKVYDKAERGTPEFLQPAYAPVKIGEDKELLQVSDQFDPIFLLNQTGGIVADVLSDVAHLDRVNGAIRLAEKDRKDSVSARKIREQDVVVLTARLIQFDGLDTALAKARDIEDRLEVLEASEKKVAILQGFLERGTAVGQHIKSFETAMKADAPDPAHMTTLTETRRRVSHFIAQVAERKKAFLALQAISGVEAPLPEPLRTQMTTYESLRGWHTKVSVIKTLKDRVSAVNAVPELVPGPLSVGVETYVGLVRLARRYETLASQVGLVTKQHGEIEAEGASIQSEWDALGVCPTCTQPFHAGGHETQV